MRILGAMKVVFVPTRLFLVALLPLLYIPMMGFHVILVSQAPWWNVPINQVSAWSIGFAVTILPLVYWIARGREWALKILMGIVGGWLLVSLVIAFRQVNFWLACYDLFVLAYSLLTYIWINRELRRSFFDPQTHWYQGAPRAIPELSCSVYWSLKKGQDQEEHQVNGFRVSRFDQDGAFVFLDHHQSFDWKKMKNSKSSLLIRFEHKGKEVECNGLPVRILRSNQGLGLKFVKLSPDQRKDLGDFVEQLRGGGHVF